MIINKSDNVRVDIASGHKYALCDIKAGEPVIKYGYPIGNASLDIKAGEHVHTHNVKTRLSDLLTYSYTPKLAEPAPAGDIPTFMGYRRKNGDVGIRNEIWVIPTVGCVNKSAKAIAERTGAFCFEHPYGCSQLGDDQLTTQKILSGLINHPNAAAVLVLGLGCENSNIDELKKVLGSWDDERVKFLVAQEVEDEIETGIAIVEALKAYRDRFVREPIPVSELRVGLKCGGSDGLSGITANPLVGEFSDMLVAYGGTTILTEVPEMFGAETILMDRCVSREVFDKTVAMINDFKTYYMSMNQPIYENPSPGNKAGGISTLEEKSLGCVQKGGTSNVTDVIALGSRPTVKGLNLLTGPGNDIVACTNLAASGAHMILFTTGRGTPLGAPVPTVKVATNSRLAKNKPAWIDFDAEPKLTDPDLKEKFFEFVLAAASGEECANERRGFREIAIFKNGVTL